MTLARDVFVELIGPMNELISRESERREKETQKAQRPAFALGDLKELALLGVGAFGRVTLVLHEATDKTYALKTLRKGQVGES